ncbi:hypothetical protein AKJ39_05320 [candidate division MSBL1 archaeon SCGC-AAA259J03]|uniref:Uncharacterized protein n=2 Tax=candidate division MSBL1 TaxID=215777 RepID=A0A656YUU6_9EURY|nr:hypothetical protein AKJ66_00310 [candidate division MSBL1 archaeon SCGC-AAA259E22]KXA95940.1 hypothetical protein AKJ39_05320 [candidate division MSBL1 archaeon SCGC-AAA259J03]
MRFEESKNAVKDLLVPSLPGQGSFGGKIQLQTFRMIESKGPTYLGEFRKGTMMIEKGRGKHRKKISEPKT